MQSASFVRKRIKEIVDAEEGITTYQSRLVSVGLLIPYRNNAAAINPRSRYSAFERIQAESLHSLE